MTEQVNKNIQTWLCEAPLQSAEVSHLSITQIPIRVSACIGGEVSKALDSFGEKP